MRSRKRGRCWRRRRKRKSRGDGEVGEKEEVEEGEKEVEEKEDGERDKQKDGEEKEEKVVEVVGTTLSPEHSPTSSLSCSSWLTVAVYTLINIFEGSLTFDLRPSPPLFCECVVYCSTVMEADDGTTWIFELAQSLPLRQSQFSRKCAPPPTPSASL